MGRNGDEFLYPGGVYFEGCTDAGNRTDVYLQQSGPQKTEHNEGLVTLGLRFVSGSTDYVVLGIIPSELAKLGRWLAEMGDSPEFGREEQT